MGTTEKLGVGVNVQERLLSAHHLDAPPRPMDFEQRNGRIRRPGNMFPEVEVLTYGTKNTLDSVTFQQLISKQKFINQLLRGDVGTRTFENPFDATQATFEDMMAAFSGNPLAKEKMQLQVEVRRLEALNAAYESRLGTLRYNLRSAKSSLEFLEGRTKSAEAVTAFVNEHFPDGEIEGRKELSKDVSAWLDGELKRIEKVLSGSRKYAQWQVKNPRDYAAGMTVELGNGVSAEVSVLPHVAEAGGELSKGVAMSYQLAGPHGIKESGPFNGAAGLFTRLKNDLARYAGSAAENAAKIKGAKAQIASLEEELKRPFEQKKELEDARERMLEIEQKLAETSKKPDTEEAPMASVRRGLGAAFTFKTFTANLLGLWSWALRTQGKEGRIMVAKGLASTIALGGLVSTPFYATVMALVQAVSGDDDDWTEAIRKQLPQNTMLRDIVCYGLPAGAGVNLGGSLKMELALTGGMQKGGTPKEVLTEGIGDIIGIPWDMFVERPSKVMEAMRADNYWRAVEEVVPTAVSNGMKAWRLATEGQKTLKGRDINDPGEQGARKLSSGEAFGKLLGFQPVSATRSYDAYTASKHSDSVRADKADEVATIMVKALDAGDSAEMVRARKVLKDWNVKMEEEGKPHMRILMKDVQKRVTQRRRKARMTPKARQKGEAFQSVWGEA